MTIKPIVDFFRITEAESEILNNEILKENVRRILYLSLVAIPISIFHVLYFSTGLQNSTGVEYTWKFYIILSHLSIIVFLPLVNIMIHFFAKRSTRKNNAAIFGIHLLLILLLLIGVVITTIDQLVTTAINPYIVVCMASSILLLVRPLYAMAYYSIGYVIFYYSLALTQTNAEILISNRVNGITITGIGLCLSVIFWRNYLLRVQQRKIIEVQKNELQESNKAKDKLFSVIAHDLRSPYATIIGLTQLLSEDLENMGTQEIKSIMQTLNKETELSFELLNNLLSWSRTQLNKFEPKVEDIPVNELIVKTFSMVESMASKKQITLTAEIKEDLHARADLPMVQSIVKNLLTNAIKFTPRGGQVVAMACQQDSQVKFSIRDSGIGMSPEQSTQLFNQNNDFTSAGTENEKGTGLGLQICKEFTELNKGHIWVDSVPGKGSTFSFTLPSK